MRSSRDMVEEEEEDCVYSIKVTNSKRRVERRATWMLKLCVWAEFPNAKCDGWKAEARQMRQRGDDDI